MKVLLFFVLMFCSFIEPNISESVSKGENPEAGELGSSLKSPLANEYGIYGEIVWPVSGTAESAIESPVVTIEKLVNGSWIYHGTTYASACGYYTYDTGGTGEFRAVVGGYYYMRTYPGCATRVSYGWHAGSGEGNVTYWTPWRVVNIRCS